MTAELGEEEATKEQPRPPEATIAGEVLARLGRPDGLHDVHVRPVGRGKYRVNVYVRAAAGSHRVAHSFFIEADDRGAVLSSSPAIARTYPTS